MGGAVIMMASKMSSDFRAEGELHDNQLSLGTVACGPENGRLIHEGWRDLVICNWRPPS